VRERQGQEIADVAIALAFPPLPKAATTEERHAQLDRQFPAAKAARAAVKAGRDVEAAIAPFLA
jgi:hypothetical protein